MKKMQRRNKTDKDGKPIEGKMDKKDKGEGGYNHNITFLHLLIIIYFISHTFLPHILICFVSSSEPPDFHLLLVQETG